MQIVLLPLLCEGRRTLDRTWVELDLGAQEVQDTGKPECTRPKPASSSEYKLAVEQRVRAGM